MDVVVDLGAAAPVRRAGDRGARDEGSGGMPAHAADGGWIDDHGAARAHVEWRDA